MGMRLKGKFGTWFKGAMSEGHSGGCFDVQYDDGDREERVRWSSVLKSR